jgi:hypothetical protein
MKNPDYFDSVPKDSIEDDVITFSDATETGIDFIPFCSHAWLVQQITTAGFQFVAVLVVRDSVALCDELVNLLR